MGGIYMKNRFDLEERTTEFAKAMIRLCKSLPRNTINERLISQAVRAAGSIGANYREANDPLGKKDFIFRLKITRKEAKESHHWLECILEANSHQRTEIQPLLNESIELKKIFSSIIDKLERKNKQKILNPVNNQSSNYYNK